MPFTVTICVLQWTERDRKSVLFSLGTHSIGLTVGPEVHFTTSSTIVIMSTWSDCLHDLTERLGRISLSRHYVSLFSIVTLSSISVNRWWSIEQQHPKTAMRPFLRTFILLRLLCPHLPFHYFVVYQRWHEEHTTSSFLIKVLFGAHFGGFLLWRLFFFLSSATLSQLAAPAVSLFVRRRACHVLN